LIDYNTIPQSIFKIYGGFIVVSQELATGRVVNREKVKSDSWIDSSDIESERTYR
jgi:hypothetical protein